MPCFFRLIHVSDLHFGNTLSPPWWAVHNFVPGWEPHSIRVAQELSNSVLLENLKDPVPSRIVATGDLTTWGRPSGFDLAFGYLRGSFQIPGTPATLGLAEPEACVIPGNHDAWSGTVFGFGRSATATISQFFNNPAPGCQFGPNGTSFPYQVLLHAGPPAVYLYGLDSTQLESSPHPVRLHTILADGYVGGQQLSDLARLVRTEQAGVPKIRMAAIHHPLGYMQTFGPAPTKILLNFDDVLETLQNLGFAIALCGHEHRGFVRVNSVPDTARSPVYVFSAGSATQTIYPWHPTSSGPGIGNEYRIYDFSADRDPYELRIDVRVFEYDPSRWVFDQAQPLPLSFSLRQYP